jgi:plasmid stabilization system protein ParE
MLDLEDARAHISEEDPDAAGRVAARILGAVDRLSEHPGIGRPGRVPGTPYLIPYRVRDSVIEILRIFHTRRRWPERF